ncbi:alcohol dehydrogenase catalytic domain-containing protein, partial [Actinomadura fulvescens]
IEQGYTAGDFDLVIAAGTLHLATDLRAALGRISALLAPDGLLLTTGPHRPDRDICTVGMLAEFWSRTDHELRPHSPLLERRQWTLLLAEAGFTKIVQTGDDHEPALGDFSVVLATAGRASATTRTTPGAAMGPVGGADGSAGGADGSADGNRQSAADPATTWIIAGEDGPTELTDTLQALMQGGDGQVAQVPLHDPDQWNDLVPADAEALTLVIILGGPAAEHGSDPAPGTVVEQLTRRAAALRAFAAACQRPSRPLRVSLWLVARPCGALPEPDIGDAAMHPEDAATWGTTRTLANEHPHIKVRRVCVHPSGDAVHDARRLAAEFLDAGDEDELLLTRQGRFVPRLVEAGDHTVRTPIGPATAFKLHIHNPGRFFTPVWRQTTPPVPGPDQVTIEVRATGLNYRDLMCAVNLLPSQAMESLVGGHHLGLECAGVVATIGSDVTGFSPGDRVLICSPCSITTHAVAQEEYVVGIPDTMTFTAAAGIPMAFATALHALTTCARLEAGETVLVHGGAGGVGLASLHYAHLLGA